VKYFKGNFPPGREFIDDVHLHEQLAEWMTTIADVRIHGTTHERPIDRFDQAHLNSSATVTLRARASLFSVLSGGS